MVIRRDIFGSNISTGLVQAKTRHDIYTSQKFFFLKKMDSIGRKPGYSFSTSIGTWLKCCEKMGVYIFFTSLERHQQKTNNFTYCSKVSWAKEVKEVIELPDRAIPLCFDISFCLQKLGVKFLRGEGRSLKMLRKGFPTRARPVNYVDIEDEEVTTATEWAAQVALFFQLQPVVVPHVHSVNTPGTYTKICNNVAKLRMDNRHKKSASWKQRGVL